MLEAAWQGRPVAAALTPYTHTIDDIRAALGWSFAPDGDATIGLRLTAASANLWFHLSLMDEYRTQVEAALAILRRAPSPDGAIELRLLIALGHAIYHSQGPGPQMAEAFTRGLALAEQFHSTAQQLQAVWGLWAVRSTSGDYPASLVLAEKYAQLAHGFGDEDTALFADRTLALSFHWLGEHEQAWQHTQSTLAHPSTIVRRTPGNGFQLNHQAAGRPIIARVHWMRGYPDQALATAKQIMADALLVEHPPSACYVLAVAACPVAIWAGDFALAHSLTAILRRTATENALTFWQMFARCYEFALSYIDPENGEIVVGVDEFARDPRLGLRHLETLSTLHPDLLSAKVLADLEAGSTTWSRPEILRAKGERILRHGGHQAAESAEACFQQSIEIARQQQALSWELRAAISLARLWRDSGRGADGHRQLQAAYGRFGEGFGTTDLMTAAQLLRELGSPQ
jgi:tetratricopeptide (TPR) repeat protein